jgi:pantoate kinase
MRGDVMKAFVPAGLSGFFEIRDRNPDGSPKKRPERRGARGGSIVINKGVLTEVYVSKSDETAIQVYINDKLSSKDEGVTTKEVVETILSMAGGGYKATIKHWIDVPIAAGFGTSASGALGTALALSKALNLPLTYNQIGRIAHIAEVKQQTGLQGVTSVMFGGCGITLREGAPGVCLRDFIPLELGLKVVVGYKAPIFTRNVLVRPEMRNSTSMLAKRVIRRVLRRPTIESYLRACESFALDLGLATDLVKTLLKEAKKAGALGAAQNMVGEAVHAVINENSYGKLVNAFREYLPEENIIVADIDFQGARLVR